jgi:nitroreductase
MELFEAIKNRRSVRRYTPDPVDDKKIAAILEAGRWAPSWANTQCWRFIVVRDPGTKARVAATFMKSEIKGETVDNPMIKVINTVPVLIVICAEVNKSGKKPGPGGGGGDFITDKGDWFMFDTALAVENMVLAAHALGLGTVILGTFDARQAEKALGVPEGFRIVTMFPVGVPQPAQEVKVPPRKELAEIAFKDKWGK